MANEHHTDADGDAEQRSRMARALATGGFEDVLVTDHETARTVLTEKRQELIARIREGNIESVRGLPDDLDRDVSGVSRDLHLLFRADIVEFETDGQRKIPTSSTRPSSPNPSRRAHLERFYTSTASTAPAIQRTPSI